MRLVAIAPADEGLTSKEMPRLWWYQSADTRSGELEFVLSELSGRGGHEVLRRPVPPMKKGFNVVDLANPNVNPERLKLKNGTSYQWTINLRHGSQLTPVYCRMRMAALDPAPGREQTAEEQLARLSNTKNWYELFDLMASLPPGPDEKFEGRATLIKQVGLEEITK